MKQKTLLRGALLGLVLLLLPALSSDALTILVNGPTTGRWDLPTRSRDGAVMGTLFDLNGGTVFSLTATLTNATRVGRSQIEGTIQGDLADGSGQAFPKFEISGTWTANRRGQGRFQAFISRQISPSGPIVLIGEISGRFFDPPFRRGAGRYRGVWEACL